MATKAIISGIFFTFFLALFISSVRERNWFASLLWFIPVSIFIVCWGIVLLPQRF